MSKHTRQVNLTQGESDLESLVAFDYQVHQFSAIHFRISRRLDVWPSTKRWYDHKTHVSGHYENLIAFVKGYLPPHGK